MRKLALIFYFGAVLAASEFTVDDVVKVFSLLLFSIGYAAQILSWSRFLWSNFTKGPMTDSISSSSNQYLA